MNFWLPLPPRECSSNMHPKTVRERIQFNQKIADYKEQCRYSLLGQKSATTLHYPIIFTLEFYYSPCRTEREKYLRGHEYHPRDVSNAISASKQLIDSFVSAKILPDDSYHYIAEVRCRIYPTGDKNGVQVILEEET
jgi:Holliday junction resolvase RusA-like endonuclease